MLALVALVVVFAHRRSSTPADARPCADRPAARSASFQFANYIKLLAAGVGILLVLLAWPTNATRPATPRSNFGTEAGEFFALMLLSIAGIFLVAGANDIILLFLGIELASIPTYIMVSISRPLPVAQEAGVKYFFLGAMAAAVMLFGFSYLYGTTGATKLDEIGDNFRAVARRTRRPTHARRRGRCWRW